VCDYAMMLFPDAPPSLVASPGVVLDRARRVSALAGLPLERLLGWAFCVAAQYAGWFHGQPMGEAMMAVALKLSEETALAGI